MTPAGVVTVADLLNRNAPVPVKIEVDDAVTQTISVGTLLRREGRAPHAADRPLQPRGHEGEGEAAEKAEKSADDRRVLVRRGAIAAGTLLAAGSVLGAAVLTDVVPTGQDVQADGAQDGAGGAYPGQGLLDGQDGVAAPPVIDPASVQLDAGTAPPDSWIPVAFPSALAGVPTGTAAAAATPESTDSDDSGTGGGVGDGPGGSSGGSDGSSSDSSTPPPAAATDDNDDNDDNSSADNSSDDDGGLVKDLTSTVGDTVRGLGGGGDSDDESSASDDSSKSDDSSDSDDDNDDDDDNGDLVGGVTDGLADTVDGVGDTLDKVTSPLLSTLSADDNDDDSGRSSSDSDDDSDESSRSSRSSAPQHDEGDSESDDDGGSDDGGSSSSDDGGDSGGGVLDSVGDLAGGLLG